MTLPEAPLTGEPAPRPRQYKGLTQKQRVLLALRRRGDDGITAADFIGPTLDDGNPIMRLAARIHELREEGHEIVNAGHRGVLDVYVLKPAAEGDRFWTPAETLFHRQPHAPSIFCQPGCVHEEAA